MGDSSVLLFLAGDVMTGRGVDQVLPRPGAPELREPHVRDARGYVELAEAANGPIPSQVDVTWPWGDALPLLDAWEPAVRVLNVETSVTSSDDFARGKSVHYRMHPDNVGCLAAVRPDVCVLANNHVLDFGERGLRETLATLERAGLRAAGAGADTDRAERPARVRTDGGRVLVWSVADGSSGVPSDWAAADGRPGVAVVRGLSEHSAAGLAERVRREKRAGDIAVVSIHWGSNWGYDIPRAQRRFAHRLVDGGVDVVHGHSSHHPRPVEVYRGRLILYGCGDLVNDYEGIGGHEEYRDDLRLLYLPSLAPSGELRQLRMVPVRARRMRLEQAAPADADWLRRVLTAVGRGFGCRLDADAEGRLVVRPV